MEISSMFRSSNPYKRRDEDNLTQNAFISKTVPLVGYIKDILVIILVIVFADGVLWIAITIIFVPSVIREFLQFMVGIIWKGNILVMEAFCIMGMTMIIIMGCIVE